MIHKKSKVDVLFFLLIAIIVFALFLGYHQRNKIRFHFAFNKMKQYYQAQNGSNYENFLSDFRSILAAEPNHEPTLANIIYFLLSRNDSASIVECYDYIRRLKQIDSNNALYNVLELRLYERLVYLNLYAEQYYDFPLCKMARDTLAFFANHIYQKFPENYIVRINVVQFLKFKSFSEREDFLAESIKLLNENNIKQKLYELTDKFIERYTSEKRYFFSVTNIESDDIEELLVRFYDFHFQLSGSLLPNYLNRLYALGFKRIRISDARFEKFPLPYENFLEETYRHRQAADSLKTP